MRKAVLFIAMSRGGYIADARGSGLVLRAGRGCKTAGAAELRSWSAPGGKGKFH